MDRNNYSIPGSQYDPRNPREMGTNSGASSGLSQFGQRTSSLQSSFPPAGPPSLFGLISNVNKGILKQPSKGILKKPKPPEERNEPNVGVLTKQDPSNKEEAFLAAKSKIEQIQMGLWKSSGQKSQSKADPSTKQESVFKVPFGVPSARPAIPSTDVKPKTLGNVSALHKQTAYNPYIATDKPSALASLVDYADDESTSETTDNETPKHSQYSRDTALQELDMYMAGRKKDSQSQGNLDEDRKRKSGKAGSDSYKETFGRDLDGRYYSGSDLDRDDDTRTKSSETDYSFRSGSFSDQPSSDSRYNEFSTYDEYGTRDKYEGRVFREDDEFSYRYTKSRQQDETSRSKPIKESSSSYNYGFSENFDKYSNSQTTEHVGYNHKQIYSESKSETMHYSYGKDLFKPLAESVNDFEKRTTDVHKTDYERYGNVQRQYRGNESPSFTKWDESPVTSPVHSDKSPRDFQKEVRPDYKTFVQDSPSYRDGESQRSLDVVGQNEDPYFRNYSGKNDYEYRASFDNKSRMVASPKGQDRGIQRGYGDKGMGKEVGFEYERGPKKDFDESETHSDSRYGGRGYNSRYIRDIAGRDRYQQFEEKQKDEYQQYGERSKNTTSKDRYQQFEEKQRDEYQQYGERSKNTTSKDRYQQSGVSRETEYCNRSREDSRDKAREYVESQSKKRGYDFKNDYEGRDYDRQRRYNYTEDRDQSREFNKTPNENARDSKRTTEREYNETQKDTTRSLNRTTDRNHGETHKDDMRGLNRTTDKDYNVTRKDNARCFNRTSDRDYDRRGSNRSTDRNSDSYRPTAFTKEMEYDEFTNEADKTDQNQDIDNEINLESILEKELTEYYKWDEMDEDEEEPGPVDTKQDTDGKDEMYEDYLFGGTADSEPDDDGGVDKQANKDSAGKGSSARVLLVEDKDYKRKDEASSKAETKTGKTAVGFTCKDCNITCADKAVYDVHLQSDTHILTLQRKAQELFQMPDSVGRTSRFETNDMGQPLVVGGILPPPGLVSLPQSTMITGVPAPTAIINSQAGMQFGRNVFSKDEMTNPTETQIYRNRPASGIQVIPPKPMGPLEANNIRARRLGVFWRKLTDIEEGMIDKYVVEYRNARETHWVTVGNTSGHEYIVDGLQENTDYLFRVVAMNGSEKSEFLESILITTSKREGSPSRRRSRSRERNKRVKSSERKRSRSTEKGRSRSQERKRSRSSERKGRKPQTEAKEKSEKSEPISEEQAAIDLEMFAKMKSVADNEIMKERPGYGPSTVRGLRREKEECRLYKLFKKYSDAPLLGLDYIYEIVSYNPTSPSHYICKLCNNKGPGEIIMKHINGYAHRMACIKLNNPVLFDALEMLPTRKEKMSKATHEAKIIEDKLGRGCVNVMRMLNPADHNGKVVFKEPVAVKAPTSTRPKISEKQSLKLDDEKEPEESEFMKLYTAALEAEALPDKAIIGLDLVKEFLHPQNADLPKYICSLCKCCLSHGTILFHLIGKKHRMQYLKRNHTALHDQLSKSSNFKKELPKVAADVEEKFGMGMVKTATAKTDRLWRTRNKDKNDDGDENLASQELATSTSEDGTKAIKFGIKKVEEPSTPVIQKNVFEEATKQSNKDILDWSKENEALQAKIQNQSIIKSSRKSKFISVYSGSFRRHAVIGMQWVTEFQRPDPKAEPWFMCFNCQQKLQWKTILDHVTSTAHRFNYLKTSYKELSKSLYERIGSSKQGMRTLLEEYAQKVVKIEGHPTEVEVMIELSINTEALKSFMKIKDNVKSTSATTLPESTSLSSSAETTEFPTLNSQEALLQANSNILASTSGQQQLNPAMNQSQSMGFMPNLVPNSYGISSLSNTPVLGDIAPHQMNMPLNSITPQNPLIGPTMPVFQASIPSLLNINPSVVAPPSWQTNVAETLSVNSLNPQPFAYNNLNVDQQLASPMQLNASLMQPQLNMVPSTYPTPAGIVNTTGDVNSSSGIESIIQRHAEDVLTKQILETGQFPAPGVIVNEQYMAGENSYVDNRFTEHSAVDSDHVLFSGTGEDRTGDMFGDLRDNMPDDVNSDRMDDIHDTLSYRRGDNYHDRRCDSLDRRQRNAIHDDRRDNFHNDIMGDMHNARRKRSSSRETFQDSNKRFRGHDPHLSDRRSNESNQRSRSPSVRSNNSKDDHRERNNTIRGMDGDRDRQERDSDRDRQSNDRERRGRDSGQDRNARDRVSGKDQDEGRDKRHGNDSKSLGKNLGNQRGSSRERVGGRETGNDNDRRERDRQRLDRESERGDRDKSRDDRGRGDRNRERSDRGRGDRDSERERRRRSPSPRRSKDKQSSPSERRDCIPDKVGVGSTAENRQSRLKGGRKSRFSDIKETDVLIGPQETASLGSATVGMNVNMTSDYGGNKEGFIGESHNSQDFNEDQQDNVDYGLEINLLKNQLANLQRTHGNDSNRSINSVNVQGRGNRSRGNVSGMNRHSNEQNFPIGATSLRMGGDNFTDIGRDFSSNEDTNEGYNPDMAWPDDGGRLNAVRGGRRGMGGRMSRFSDTDDTDRHRGRFQDNFGQGDKMLGDSSNDMPDPSREEIENLMQRAKSLMNHMGHLDEGETAPDQYMDEDMDIPDRSNFNSDRGPGLGALRGQVFDSPIGRGFNNGRGQIGGRLQELGMGNNFNNQGGPRGGPMNGMGGLMEEGGAPFPGRGGFIAGRGGPMYGRGSPMYGRGSPVHGRGSPMRGMGGPMQGRGSPMSGIGNMQRGNFRGRGIFRGN